MRLLLKCKMRDLNIISKSWTVEVSLREHNLTSNSMHTLLGLFSPYIIPSLTHTLLSLSLNAISSYEGFSMYCNLYLLRCP